MQKIAIDSLQHPSIAYNESREVVSMTRPYISVFRWGVRRYTTARRTHNTTAFIPFHPDAPPCSVQTTLRPLVNTG